MRNVVGEFAHLLDDRNNVDSVLLVEVAEVGQVNKVVSDSRHMGIVRSLNLTTNISRSKFQAYWQPKKNKIQGGLFGASLTGISCDSRWRISS